MWSCSNKLTHIYLALLFTQTGPCSWKRQNLRFYSVQLFWSLVWLLGKSHVDTTLLPPALAERSLMQATLPLGHQKPDSCPGVLSPHPVPHWSSRSSQWVLGGSWHSWIFIEALILKRKIQYFVHLIQRADSLEKTLMLGKQKEKGVAEDEMVGWHHQLNGREFGQTLGISEGQRRLVCCSPGNSKESDTTEWLNKISAPLPGLITSWACCQHTGSFRDPGCKARESTPTGDSQATLPMPAFSCGEKGWTLSGPSIKILVWGFRQYHWQPANAYSTSYWLEMTWARHLPPGSSASLSINREYLTPTPSCSI